MPLDNSIYNQLLRPPKTVAEYDAEALANQTNALGLQQGRMKMDEYQRSVTDGNKLRQVVSSFGADKGANYNALVGAGRLDEAQKYLKSNADIGKVEADAKESGSKAAKLDLEAVGIASQQHKDMLTAVNDPQTAAKWVAAAYNDPRLAAISSHGGTLEEAISRIPTDPKAFAEWKMQSSLGADKLIEYTRASANTVANNQTSIATNAATNATSRANTASNNAVQIRGQNMTDARAKEANSAGKTPAGYRLNPDGKTMSFIPGGPADPNVGGGKMTEDQSKATGWLVQAENAFGNLRKVAFDKDGRLTSAAMPGIGDSIAAIPGMSGIGNSLRSTDRQKFNQAASSGSEALLRAATGAGVNYEEAKQKVEELTPVWGDKPETIQQKFDAIPLYLESLRVRAGAGAKKAEAIKTAANLPSATKLAKDIHAEADAILKGGK